MTCAGQAFSMAVLCALRRNVGFMMLTRRKTAISTDHKSLGGFALYISWATIDQVTEPNLPLLLADTVLCFDHWDPFCGYG